MLGDHNNSISLEVLSSAHVFLGKWDLGKNLILRYQSLRVENHMFSNAVEYLQHQLLFAFGLPIILTYLFTSLFERSGSGTLQMQDTIAFLCFPHDT